MVEKLLIEPHYLGSLEYYNLLAGHKEVLFEVCQPFEKQTFQSRCEFLGSNKIQKLSVPVNYSSSTLLKDVKVAYSQRWVKDHWGAFYSSYGKAPFFEYFENEFHEIWEMAPKYLVELNVLFVELINKLLGLPITIELTETSIREQEGGYSDYRNVIKPKNHFSSRNIYKEVPYTQLFGDTFVPNLSVVDLLLCEGPNASSIIRQSSRVN